MLPEGFIASQCPERSAGRMSTEPLDLADINKFWKVVFTTTRRRISDPTAERLENYWWRIWGSRCRELNEATIAQLFARISNNEDSIAMQRKTTRVESCPQLSKTAGNEPRTADLDPDTGIKPCIKQKAVRLQSALKRPGDSSKKKPRSRVSFLSPVNLTGSTGSPASKCLENMPQQSSIEEDRGISMYISQKAVRNLSPVSPRKSMAAATLTFIHITGQGRADCGESGTSPLPQVDYTSSKLDEGQKIEYENTKDSETNTPRVTEKVEREIRSKVRGPQHSPRMPAPPISPPTSPAASKTSHSKQNIQTKHVSFATCLGEEKRRASLEIHRGDGFAKEQEMPHSPPTSPSTLTTTKGRKIMRKIKNHDKKKGKRREKSKGAKVAEDDAFTGGTLVEDMWEDVTGRNTTGREPRKAAEGSLTNKVFASVFEESEEEEEEETKPRFLEAEAFQKKPLATQPRAPIVGGLTRLFGQKAQEAEEAQDPKLMMKMNEENEKENLREKARRHAPLSVS